MLNGDEIMTAKEVAITLKVSRSLVYKLRAEGSLPARYKILPGEKGWRWSAKDVHAFLRHRQIRIEPDSEALTAFFSIDFKPGLT